MIHAIIVDDEFSAIESLKWELSNFCADVKVIESFTSPTEAVSAINYLKPDLVFLDIEMPELDGFQLLKRLSYRNFSLIITTAYNQYAIQAFKENAIDYLLKPVDPDELVRAVEKISTQKTDTANIEKIFERFLKTEKTTHLSKVPLALSDRVLMVEKSEIMYCVSDGNYTNVVLRNGKSHLLSKTIKSLGDILPSPQFLRVHKKYMVNTEYITEYLRGDGGEILMTDKQNIPVSRTHKEALMKSLQII